MAVRIAWIMVPMLFVGVASGVIATILDDEDALPTEQHVQLRDGRDVVFLQDPDGAWHLVPDGKEMDQ